MKKVILLVFISLMLCGCANTKDVMEDIEITGVCQKEEEAETHGGFLGDGETFVKLSCKNVELSDNWMELPLTESIMQILNLIQCDNNGCKSAIERYNINTSNGYYYFRDRHSETINEYDDTELNNRSSYNFTMAIYNTDTNTIYYYEMDT